MKQATPNKASSNTEHRHRSPTEALQPGLGIRVTGYGQLLWDSCSWMRRDPSLRTVRGWRRDATAVSASNAGSSCRGYQNAVSNLMQGALARQETGVLVINPSLAFISTSNHAYNCMYMSIFVLPRRCRESSSDTKDRIPSPGTLRIVSTDAQLLSCPRLGCILRRGASFMEMCILRLSSTTVMESY